MRTVVNVVGVVLVLMGVGWFFQGIGVLPGSFMTGDLKWSVYGGIAAAVGVGLVLKFGRRAVTARTIAVLLLLMGSIWFFQGINVLPGSFMTGDIKWAIYGGIADAIAVGLLVLSRRWSPRDLGPA